MISIKKEDLVHPGALTDSMRCPICSELFEEPVFACGKPCQHVFCRACIKVKLEERSKCPTCKQSTRYSNMVPQQLMQNLIDEMLVLCPCRCGWNGRRDSLVAHLGNCQLAIWREEMSRVEDRIKANRQTRHWKEVKIKQLQGQLMGEQKAADRLDEDHSLMLIERDELLAKLDGAPEALAFVIKRQLSETDDEVEAKQPRLGADANAPASSPPGQEAAPSQEAASSSRATSSSDLLRPKRKRETVSVCLSDL